MSNVNSLIARGFNPGLGAVQAEQFKYQDNRNRLADSFKDRQFGVQKRKLDMREGNESQKRAVEGMKILGKMAVHLKETPEPERPALYAQQRQLLEQMGMNVSVFPEQYIPGLEDMAIAEIKKNKYGKSLQFYRDSEGRLQAAQVNEAGGVMPVEAPGGGEWMKPQTLKDIGGSVVAVPYGQGTPTSDIPKTLTPSQQPEYLSEAETAKTVARAVGKHKAAAAVDYPKMKEQAEHSIQLLEDLVDHPGLPGAVGMKGIYQGLGLMDEPIAGSEEADFVVRLKQIQGKQFLEAYQGLRGGGQITEIEGAKAEAAVARMSAAQSEAEFKKSVREFINIIKMGLARAKKEAGKSTGLSQSEQAELEALRRSQQGGQR